MIDPSSPAHQLVGAVLNARWKLLRLLGEGGMGAVYEADSVRGEGKRAIKLLHPEFAHNEEILQRFFIESQATQGLGHPNIADVYESARAENGTPYIVMELLQGIPLGAYVNQGSAIPPHQATPITLDVLKALSAAHARKLVHRDLKPDNLFLVRDAHGAFIVKVLDFGIAKVMDLVGGMGTKTRTGALLGTPGYMSPEQIKSSKGVDPRSDLWSLAVIFYEMLTAQQPFIADNEFARLTVVLTTDARPIEQVTPHLAAWGPFFRRALAKDPAHRFQSAEEMAQAMTAVARSGSMAPPPVTMGERSASIPVSLQRPLPLEGARTSAAGSPAAPLGPSTLSSGPAPQAGVTAISGAAPYAAGQPSSAPLYPPSPAGPTHVSAQKPAGTPTISSVAPDVQVVAAPRPSQGAAWWIVGVVAVVCLGLGFALGALVGG